MVGLSIVDLKIIREFRQYEQFYVFHIKKDLLVTSLEVHLDVNPFTIHLNLQDAQGPFKLKFIVVTQLCQEAFINRSLAVLVMGYNSFTPFFDGCLHFLRLTRRFFFNNSIHHE